MRYILFIYLLASFFLVHGQEYEYTEAEIYRSPIRAILNKFSVTVTTGYSSTQYKQDLSGVYLLQSPDQQLITANMGPFDPNAFPRSYQDWFNAPMAVDSVDVRDFYDIPFQRLDNPVNNPLLQQGFRAYDVDSLGIDFEGKGWGIPVNVAIRFNIDRIRIGAGFSLEFHQVGPLDPTRSDLAIRPYQPNFTSAVFNRYYGQIGYRFYDFWDFSFAGELEIGKNNLGGKFNSGLIGQGLYYSLGISIEKNLSEYFRVIVKPSYDIRSYSIHMPLSTIDISHQYSAFNVMFGVSITIPEIPRSPMKSDHVQLKHVITDPKTGRHMEVRGQPIWKRQNPKVGENHRRIWRDKMGNRRKINPY